MEICTTEIWTMAFEQGALDPFYQAIGRVAPGSVVVTQVCHTAGHNAGRAAVIGGKDPAELMTTTANESGVRNNGFLHGVLDEFAGSTPSSEQFRPVVTACVANRDEGRPGSTEACVDGLGHAAWLATHDTAAATQICLMLTDEHDRTNCTGGIVMQMGRWDDYTGAAPIIDSNNSVNEIMRICSEMEAAGATRSMMQGCLFQGAVFWVGELSKGFEVTLGLDDERKAARDRTNIAEFKAMYEHCDEFGPDADSCRNRLATGVTWAVGGQTELQQPICLAIDDAGWRRACLDATSA